MPSDKLLFIAVGLLAVSLVAFFYGEWLWIIQTNGDAYLRTAGSLCLFASVLLVVALYRRRNR